MNNSFCDLENKVINTGLCTSCGACAGICPKGAISFVDRLETCKPSLIGECIECGMCVKTCVADGFDYNELKQVQFKFQGEKKRDENESYYVCHAKDSLIWKNSASGGFVTAALLYALRNNIIHYAVVVTNDTISPWLPKVVLASCESEIKDAMQSKYCVVPTLEILQEIKKIKEPVALVVLPCQAQAFINIRKNNPHLFNNVVFTIGLMCGNSLPFSATKDVLTHIGINDECSIVDLKYRDGLWHGDMHVRLKDGTEKGVPYVQYMRYMGDFYRKSRCKLCIDGDSMFSDICSGDGWLPGRKQDNVYGWSIVHTHTSVGESLFEKMCDDNELEFIQLSEAEALKMKHMYRRFYSSIPRIIYKKDLGLHVPIYTGFEYPEHLVYKKSLLKKRIIDFCQSILFSRFSRKILRPIPLRYKSFFLEKLLQVWFGEK